MRAIGSTRTATRWRWCSGLLLAACVTSTKHYYVAPEGQDRLTAGEMRARGDALLEAECPRLIQRANPATGTARVVLTVNGQGAVTQSRIEKSSGDARADEIFGLLSANLQFEPPQGLSGGTIDVGSTFGYSCSPSAHVLTFDLDQPKPGRPRVDTIPARLPPPGA